MKTLSINISAEDFQKLVVLAAAHFQCSTDAALDLLNNPNSAGQLIAQLADEAS